MALVVPDTAEVVMLRYIVNHMSQDGGVGPSGGQRALRLFTNDITPDDDTVIGDLTQATESGYAPVTLTGSNWSFGEVGGEQTASHPARTLTFSTGVTVFGYYVTTTEVTPKLLWVERWTDGPYEVPSGGGEIRVTPQLSLK